MSPHNRTCAKCGKSEGKKVHRFPILGTTSILRKMSPHNRTCAKCGKSEGKKVHRFPILGTTSILRATAWATYCWPDQENKMAKWDYIKQFYVSGNMNPHFVYAPFLTEKHITPNTKQKMRVKLAAQVFSHTASAGIRAKVGTNELPAEALVTATLLKNIDSLFDALNANSRDLRHGKLYSTTARSPHLEYFNKMKEFIGLMKFQNSKKVPPSKAGWIQTITAVERLWKNLGKLGVQNLSTRRLNQDPLENFFGCVRYNCGSNYNPTISQFVAGFKTAIITNLRNCGQNKNCEDDEGILSNNLKPFLMACNTHDDLFEYITEEQEESDDITFDVPAEKIADVSSEAQACAYVCGFLLKKINNKCTLCNQLLMKTCPGSEIIHNFTEMKEYDTKVNHLNYASRELVNAVETVAATCKSFFGQNLQIEKNCEIGYLVLQK